MKHNIEVIHKLSRIERDAGAAKLLQHGNSIYQQYGKLTAYLFRVGDAFIEHGS